MMTQATMHSSVFCKDTVQIMVNINITLTTVVYHNTAHSHRTIASPMNNSSTVYKVDQRYNTKASATAIVSIRSPHRSTKATGDTTPIESSLHERINHILGRWRQLQQDKQQCQSGKDQPQWQLLNKTHPHHRDDFDRIMEEDLANQLQELERQEEEQYQQMEQLVEEQLEYDDRHDQQHQFDETELECLRQSERCENKHGQSHVPLEKLRPGIRFQRPSHLKALQKRQQRQEIRQQQLCKMIQWLEQIRDLNQNQYANKYKHLHPIHNRVEKLLERLKSYGKTKKYYVQQIKQ